MYAAYVLRNKNFKRVYTKLAEVAEKNYYKQLFDTKTNSIKKLWSNLNTVCSFKKHIYNRNINRITVGNTDIVDPNDICNEFNKFFSGVGENLVKGLPDPSSNNLKVGPLDYCGPTIINSMVCESVDKEELNKLIKDLNSSKSPGLDNIGPSLIKESLHLIIEPLLFIYNLSLTTGIVPDKLKIAKVIPIYKKGEKNLTNNYRPISFLSVFDKLLEKIMHNRLYSFLQKITYSVLPSVP
jgi:hypothetical protein